MPLQRPGVSGHARRAKLSQDDVDRIRRSPEKDIRLAAKLGVNRSTISRIRNHKAWWDA